MDTWQAINAVRVVREFADRPLAPEHLDRILNAGRRAGSSKNEQRWAFIAVHDREHLRELASVGRYAGHLAGAAVAIALVTPETGDGPRTRSVMWDLGRAAQNMVLAAWELGIGSCHGSVYDEPRVRELLAYPPEMTCDLVVSFGYPADPASLAPPGSRGGRKRLGDLRHEERFGS